jgi:hypothetical protein
MMTSACNDVNCDDVMTADCPSIHVVFPAKRLFSLAGGACRLPPPQMTIMTMTMATTAQYQGSGIVVQ